MDLGAAAAAGLRPVLAHAVRAAGEAAEQASRQDVSDLLEEARQLRAELADMRRMAGTSANSPPADPEPFQ